VGDHVVQVDCPQVCEQDSVSGILCKVPLRFTVLDGGCRLLQEREGPSMTVSVEIDSS
jgi:hypothetical protein